MNTNAATVRIARTVQVITGLIAVLVTSAVYSAGAKTEASMWASLIGIALVVVRMTLIDKKPEFAWNSTLLALTVDIISITMISVAKLPGTIAVSGIISFVLYVINWQPDSNYTVEVE